MTIVEIFSKRQKKLRGEVPDVYTYTTLPQPLRVQVVHIWRDVLGNNAEYWNAPYVREAYSLIVETLCREFGLFVLDETGNYSRRDYMQELVNFFLQEKDVEKAISAVEVSFNVIDYHTRNFNYLGRSDANEIADDAINELNGRFKEHGIGYEFTNREIIRIDSEFIHSEVVKPALRLLNQKIYKGAQQEFLKAHEHYRANNAKEALNECLKAFESVMKAICDKRGWQYKTTDIKKSHCGVFGQRTNTTVLATVLHIIENST
jgi:hypothetical protein